MRDEGEARFIAEMVKIAQAAGGEVVEAHDLHALRQQPIAQMRPQKTCTACHQNAFRHQPLPIICHCQDEGLPAPLVGARKTLLLLQALNDQSRM
jgi:hypothetical protein